MDPVQRRISTYLPEHHKTTSNTGWGDLRNVDGYSGAFRAYTNTHEQAKDEQLPPVARYSLQDRRQDGEERRPKYCATSTKFPVQPWGQPDAEDATQIRSTINQAVDAWLAFVKLPIQGIVVDEDMEGNLVPLLGSIDDNFRTCESC